MAENRIRWISTCDFEGGLGAVLVRRSEVNAYLPSDASVRRLGRACDALVNQGHGIMVSDGVNALAWQLCMYSEDLWPENKLL